MIEHRPIVLARKPGPLQPLNIDDCRIGTTEDVPASPKKLTEKELGNGYGYGPRDPENEPGFNPNVGRWPSNVLLSDPELFDTRNAEVVGSGATAPSAQPYQRGVDGDSWYGTWRRDLRPEAVNGYGDSGGYSRFFRIPGDDLLGHLTKLVTPPDGVAYDPFQKENGVIHTGDCIEVMAAMDADSVDAIVTDPPYGLEFMGKEWDKLWNAGGDEFSDDKQWGRRPAGYRPQHNPNRKCRTCGKWDRDKNPCKCEAPDWSPAKQANMTSHLSYSLKMQKWHEAWGREALRVTKPGGYLLAFGGTRTHHRLVCGLEDAGWIIRDELDWIYASGFPKGKANLKPAHEPIVLARKPGPLRPLAIDECRIPGQPWNKLDGDRGAGFNTGKFLGDNGIGEPSFPPGGTRESDGGRWPSNLLLSDPALFDELNPEVVGSGAVTGMGNFPKDPNDKNPTGLIGQLSGKRATRPERIDLDSGGYSRFFIVPKADRADREPVLRGQLATGHAGVGIRQQEPGEYDQRVHDPDPATIAAYLREWRERAGLSKPEMDRRLGTVTLYSWFEGRPAGTQLPTPELWPKLKEILGFDDQYDEQMTVTQPVTRTNFDGQPPARRENAHPTVKPVDLMRHLVRLVTPQGGTVLDPFLGSGSTALACELEGFPWLGIEKEPEYVAIAEARLNGTQRGLGLDVPAPTQRQPKPDAQPYTGKPVGEKVGFWTEWREQGESDAG